MEHARRRDEPAYRSVATDPATPGNASTVQTWTYTYANDQLTQVCSPVDTANGCTKYSYTAGSQYQNQVVDLGAKSSWPLAETAGTVAASAIPAGEGNDNGTYHNVTLGQAGPLPGSSATSTLFDGSSSYVALPDLNMRANTEATISMWFKTTTAMSVLFSYGDMPIDGTQNPAREGSEPALYLGYDGKLRGMLWPTGSISSNGQLQPITTSAAVTDGQWHHVVLSGSLTGQTMWLDAAQVGTAPGVDPTVTQNAPWVDRYTHLGAGFLSNEWPAQPRGQTDGTVDRDYFQGWIADAAFSTQPATQQSVTALYQAGTHPAGLLNSITRPSGNTDATVTYDPVSATVKSVTDDKGGTWTIQPPVVTGSSQVYRSSVMGSAPATYNRLGESAGASTALDEVNAGNGTYSNVTLGTPGPFSDATAASFNGTSSFVQLPASDQVQTSPGSIEMWFKMPNGNTAGGVLFDEQSLDITTMTAAAGNYVPAMYVGTDGKLYGKFWDTNHTSGGIVTPKKVNDGLWHHAALAAAPNGQVLYLDGQKVGATTAALQASTSGFTYVGAGASGAPWPNHPTNTLGWFPGSISDAALYRTQLSSQEVANHYAAGMNSTGLSPVETVTVTDPGGKPLKYRYDVANGMRQLSETDGTGQTTSYGYDTGGFAHTITDPNGNVTVVGHDVRGNEVSDDLSKPGNAVLLDDLHDPSS
ncbi:LamG domain-containing protein [Fodinicola feengrottensis]|uniref:LamG domain-containing protein n=1 Tax=Fodinicola feengrottensis TaxID=435914 RepID=UPI0013D029AC|nr:LamG domain-containing protein [Fodinicola feengrottensis]